MFNDQSDLKKKVNNESCEIPIDEYIHLLNDLKRQIRHAQARAVLSVNGELLKLYWSIGETIAQRQEIGGWGTGVIDRFAKDLQHAFPGMKGFSRTNIFQMRAFYLAYCHIVEPEDLPFFKIPWYHNIILLTKLSNYKQRLWYAQKIIMEGWGRYILEARINSKLYSREGKAFNNFKDTLPEQAAAMALQSLKDPYCFDWLPLSEEHHEKDLEKGLVDHIQQLLLELGQGFAFVGRQVNIEVSGKPYYIDLLFYHYKLKCFVVIELKAREFDPRDAGQINFYLSAVDDTLRSEDDKPTIGLLLCKGKDRLSCEYALRRSGSPIGVAAYETMLAEKLPNELKSSLPSIEEIEAGLAKIESDDVR